MTLLFFYWSSSIFQGRVSFLRRQACTSIKFARFERETGDPELQPHFVSCLPYLVRILAVGLKLLQKYGSDRATVMTVSQRCHMEFRKQPVFYDFIFHPKQRKWTVFLFCFVLFVIYLSSILDPVLVLQEAVKRTFSRLPWYLIDLKIRVKY